MNIRIIAFCTLLMIAFSTLSAQFETRQAGVRMGYRGGVFYQVTHDAGNAEIAYNGMIGFNNNGIQLTGLKIIYETTRNEISPNLVFAWGYGGHAGFQYNDHVRFMGENYYFSNERFCPMIGLDGFAGAEYRFVDIPVNISLNVKPFIELTYPSFMKVYPWDFALSVSYVF